MRFLRPTISLEDKVAIVTGASSGIGRVTAVALAAEGMRVSLAARRESLLRDVADEIRSLGRESLVVPTDVTREEQASRLINETLACWGRVDVLVANAGAYVRCPVRELTVAEMERSMAVNFYGALHAVLAAQPHMLDQGSGHIVLVSSLDGKKGIPPDAPYAAAKFALAGYGDVLRQELQEGGVDVTTVFPGRVDTPLIKALKVPPISAKIPPQAVARAIVSSLRRPRPRVILPFQARLLYWVDVISPRMGDWLVRLFHIQGWEVDDVEEGHAEERTDAPSGGPLMR